MATQTRTSVATASSVGGTRPTGAMWPKLPRARTVIGLAIVVAALWVTAISGAVEAQAQSGAWLDQPLVSWNQPGMAIPQAPPPIELVNPQCLSQARFIENNEDQALVNAGWNLFNSYRGGWGAVVIDATTGYDGMCRPLGYQTFVFVGGVFAGTISPEPMDSRTTGAGTLTSFVNDSLSANFVRYAPTDPLCCPSLGSVDVQYKIQQTPDGPVLTPTQKFENPPPTTS